MLFFCFEVTAGWENKVPSPPGSCLYSSLLCVPGALLALLSQFFLNSSHLLALCLCSNTTSLYGLGMDFQKLFFKKFHIFQFEYVNFLSSRLVGLSYPRPQGSTYGLVVISCFILFGDLMPDCKPSAERIPLF